MLSFNHVCISGTESGKVELQITNFKTKLHASVPKHLWGLANLEKVAV